MVTAVKTSKLYQMDCLSAMRSHQALQASALVGRQVLVHHDSLSLKSEGEVLVAVDIPLSLNSLVASIHTLTGELIKQLKWTELMPRLFQFTWDGTDDVHERQITGQYKIKIYGMHEEQKLVLNPMICANVDSVSFENNGKDLRLNVAGVGSVPLASLKLL